MTATEVPFAFSSSGLTLRGLLHRPDRPRDLGVLFLHGWSGNRLGPHRLFVHQARRLAAMGVFSLRFDFRGRGESEGETFSTSLEDMVTDTLCGLEAFQRETGLRRIVLVGICSGCKVAIGAAAQRPDLAGLALWSAEAMGPLRAPTQSVRKTLWALRAYARKLATLETWTKILTGRVQTRFVRKALMTDERPTLNEIRREAAWLDAFRSFQSPVLFVYGGNDPDTAAAARAYAAFCTRHGLMWEMHEIPEANHSFYSLRWSGEVMDRTERWIGLRVIRSDGESP
jgi:pimeloyl-ACP methyl ester carboxylesterase